jgi:hypothetical protein
MEKYIDIPNIGTIKIELSNDQLERVLEEGKKQATLKMDLSNYVYRDNDSVLTNKKDGMTGNNVKWSSFFPEISEAQVNTIIEQAKNNEEMTKKETKVLATLITLGLKSYFLKSTGSQLTIDSLTSTTSTTSTSNVSSK